MKATIILTLVLSVSIAAQCPLGFTPDEACSAESPSCALFTDENGDSFCDNPQPESSEADQAEDSAGEDSTGSAGDSLEVVVDSLPEVQDTSLVPADTLQQDQIVTDVVEEPSDTNIHAAGDEFYYDELLEIDQQTSADLEIIFSSEQGHPYCIDPRNEDIAGHHCIVWELEERFTDSSTITEGVQIELSDDSVYVDTITIEQVSTPVSTCPLNYSPEEACSAENPFCTLFKDANSDSFCDNPGVLTDTSSTVSVVNVTGQVYSLVPVASGCPLGLPPEAACPSPDDPLCPHYRGLERCSNPSGGGMQRTWIVLIATAVLLVTATYLKRHFRGRRKTDRRKRKIAHITVHLISLVVLGFFVQGCFCPIGIIQYAFLPAGLLFLGGLGMMVLILPMVWSTFFGRIFCGWVCPFGALQDLLGKMHVPRPPKFPHKVHVFLSGFKYLLAIAFFGLLVLSSSGQLQWLTPEPFFCRFDPFHTVFSFFMVGSFTGAVITLSILVFFPRFFCKYLCFYGAILSSLGRIGLWKRLTRQHHLQLRVPDRREHHREGDPVDSEE